MQNSRIALLLVALLAIVSISRAQTTPGGHKALTPADSARANRYFDSISVCNLYSQRRQRYLDSALAISPWQAHLWQQKAMPLYKQKKYEAGAPYLDSAVKYDPKSYIDYRAFMKCIFQKSYQSAIPDFWAAKIIIGDGDVMDHTYDFYLGLCYLQLNRFDSACYYLDKTTTDQLKTLGEHYVHPLDLFYLAITYYETERYAQAVETFDKCLKLYPNFSDAKYYKAICLRRLHKREEAFALIKEAEQDFKQGYTINEDNTDYEAYPYQVVKPIYYSVLVRGYDTKAQ